RGPKARKFNGQRWEDDTFEVFVDPEFGDPKKPSVGITLLDARIHCQWLTKNARGMVQIVAPPTPHIWEIALFGNIRPRRQEEWLEAQARIHSSDTVTARCADVIERSNKVRYYRSYW